MMNIRRFARLIPLLTVMGIFSSTSAFAESEAQEIRKVINPTQYGYAQANAVVESSAMLYVSGQVGISENGENDFQSQVDRSFDNLLAVLKKSGARAQDIVKITLLITDYAPDKLAYMVKKRNAFFGDKPPASTLIPVTRLYTDGVMFEIDAIAVLP